MMIAAYFTLRAMSDMMFERRDDGDAMAIWRAHERRCARVARR